MRRARVPVCSSTRFAAVSTSVAAGERGVSPVITMRGGPRPGDRRQVDHRDDVERRALGEAERAEPAEGAAVGGEEDDRVRGAHALRGRRAGLRVAAGELDERGGAARVVVRARARRRCRRGAPSRRSRPATGPRATAQRLLQAATCPRPGTCASHVSADDGQAVRRELVAEPLAGAERPRRRPARGPGSASTRSAASCRVASPSKFGGRSGAGSGARSRDR